MNILFVTNKQVFPLIGGVERITDVLARSFEFLYGMHSYSLYLQENEINQSANSAFYSEYKFAKDDIINQIVEIIDSQTINAIIVQGSDAKINSVMPQIHSARNKSKNHPCIFYVFHNMPGYELVSMDTSALFYKILHDRNKKLYIKQLILQTVNAVCPYLTKQVISHKYKFAYEMSDKMIMLSESFIDQYNHFVHGDIIRYCAIPNMLSYENIVITKQKKKNVLMVARMEDKQKRIKLALSIWKNVPSTDWQLTIIGNGEDLEYYKYLAKKWNLSNVVFHGHQNPLPYYQESSIFMMTSAFEGWPMTLMEAMQNGCVPIVFDSFSAVYDIVESNKNGIIVSNNDVDTFIKDLVRLMDDENYRKQLAINANIDCQKFDKEHIVNQWMELFNSYCR